MYYDELNLKWIFIPKTRMNKLYVGQYVWMIKTNMWIYFNIGLKHIFFLKTQSFKRFVKTKCMLIYFYTSLLYINTYWRMTY